MQHSIAVRGAREHNLRAIDVDLPHGVLAAVSGVSGSGKTSLVLDTVYAEARRRFLAALDHGGDWRALRAPIASRIDGLAPALALSKKPKESEVEVHSFKRLGGPCGSQHPVDAEGHVDREISSSLT